MMKFVYVSILFVGVSLQPLLAQQNSLSNHYPQALRGEINSCQNCPMEKAKGCSECKTLPASFPKMTHTGNLLHEIKLYNAAKQTWIQAHPKQYKTMTKTPSAIDQKALQERKRKLEQHNQ